ncbi:MAG: hypothetical protein ACKVT2_08180 [Saprospiraceae bacterium]
MINPSTRVLIIRHGEKLGAPDVEGDTPSPDLSIRGSARAAALPSLFTPDPTGGGTPGQQLSCTIAAGKSLQFGGTYRSPVATMAPGPRFPTPQHIVATKKSKDSSRPIETVTPIAQALGHPIHTPSLLNFLHNPVLEHFQSRCNTNRF